ncbi:armadillo-type protein [Mucidula mucida]|nr:armadillo-type protein [Mucidula mucida]
MDDRPRQPSIWAPQPQPSESTWPKALDSFSRVAEHDQNFRAMHQHYQQQPVITREDVFGPVQTTTDVYGPPKIGAIGDGRKRNSPSGDFDDTHVEQLLRTLNLNSPDPKPPLSLSYEGSPEYSPASVSSALLTPTDMSPTRPFDSKQLHSPYPGSYINQSSLLFEPTSPTRPNHSDPYAAYLQGPTHHSLPYYKSFDHPQSLYQVSPPTSLPPSLYQSPTIPPLRPDPVGTASRTQNNSDWHIPPSQSHSDLHSSDWIHPEPVENPVNGLGLSSSAALEPPGGVGLRSSFSYQASNSSPQAAHEPINFLSLLHPSSSPPYHSFVARIIKSSDQQASIFLQQKLKVADAAERGKIVDAICARGFEMMAHRFGNWAVQRCLEAASTAEERRKIVACMRGRIVELATNCYGCHVLQKALDCEEDIRLLIVSELLLGDPAQTLVNKHASHVWSKIMELSWTPPAPPIFAYVNKSLKGKWAALACHETGSLVVQHAFENLEDLAKDGIVDELLNQGVGVFSEVTKSQWGSYCVQHILEHGSDKHRSLTLDHLISGLLEYATNEQGYKSVTKALKEGGKETLDRVVRRMCEPAKGSRRAMIVDLALSVTGSQLIASVLPTADKDQRALLYDCIRGHIVTLRGCKTGSKVIWLFDRMRAYYGY